MTEDKFMLNLLWGIFRGRIRRGNGRS